MTEVSQFPQDAQDAQDARTNLTETSHSLDTPPTPLRLLTEKSSFEQTLDEVLAEANRWLFGPEQKTLEGAKQMKQLVNETLKLFEGKAFCTMALFRLHPKFLRQQSLINKQFYMLLFLTCCLYNK